MAAEKAANAATRARLLAACFSFERLLRTLIRSALNSGRGMQGWLGYWKELLVLPAQAENNAN